MRPLVLATCVAVALSTAQAAFAHGTLTPASAAVGVSQRFELTVPNDRLDADIVEVTLRLPPDVELEAASAEQPLWSVSSGNGTVTWKGGPIARLSAETFAFTARLPAESGTVDFTLVESYDDGEAAPFPIGVTVTGSAGSSDGGGGDTLATAALVISILALGLATAALLVALRGRHPRSDT